MSCSVRPIAALICFVGQVGIEPTVSEEVAFTAQWAHHLPN